MFDGYHAATQDDQNKQTDHHHSPSSIFIIIYVGVPSIETRGFPRIPGNVRWTLTNQARFYRFAGRNRQVSEDDVELRAIASPRIIPQTNHG